MVPEKFDVVKLSHLVDAEYGNQGLDFKLLNREGFAWTNCRSDIRQTSMDTADARLFPRFDSFLPDRTALLDYRYEASCRYTYLGKWAGKSQDGPYSALTLLFWISYSPMSTSDFLLARSPTWTRSRSPWAESSSARTRTEAGFRLHLTDLELLRIAYLSLDEYHQSPSSSSQIPYDL